MKVTAISSLSNRSKSDALLLPFFEGGKAAFVTSGLTSLFSQPINAKDFMGKREEVVCHYPSKGDDVRLVLVGLGIEKELTQETLRRAYAKAICLIKEKAKSVTVVVPEVKELKGVTTAVAEGVFLSQYTFDEHLSEKKKTPSHFAFVKADEDELKRSEIVCKSVFFARDIVFNNADDVTPTFLGNMAQEFAKKHPTTVKTKILDRKGIAKEGLYLLEAVSRGSAEEPRLIVMEYTGDAKSKEISALVGKGITYDTGGLNIKPTGSMETMRCDMGGAGAVMGAMYAICELKLPINVVMVIASAENAIGPKSYKPGDVYMSHAGISVEITNTDAEGRLVLADALSYVQEKFAPTRIINLATLTGGVVIALGEEVSGLMANDKELVADLIKAGESTYERLCELPLYDEYNELLKSKIADIKNSGQRKASPIQGGLFLKRFIKKTKWAHIDIAGTAFPDATKPYQPTQATGVGVRLITTFFEQLCK